MIVPSAFVLVDAVKMSTATMEFALAIRDMLASFATSQLARSSAVETVIASMATATVSLGSPGTTVPRKSAHPDAASTVFAKIRLADAQNQTTTASTAH